MGEKVTKDDSYLGLLADFLSATEDDVEEIKRKLGPPEPDYPDGDDG